MAPLEHDQQIITDQPTQIPQVQSKGSNLFLLILLLVVAAVAGFIGYELGNRNASKPVEGPLLLPPEDQGVVCTLDAKMCPDGSSVGRIGPDCEFALCPLSESAHYEGDTYSFNYPPEMEVTELDATRVSLTNKNSTSSALIIETFVYKDFVDGLYKQPKTNTLEDQIIEFVEYETSSTANLGDRCPEVGEWIRFDKPEIEGYTMPITLKCSSANTTSVRDIWTFIKNGDSLYWLNEQGVGEVQITDMILSSLVFK